MLQSGGQQTTAFRERRRLGSSSYVSKKLFFGDRFFFGDQFWVGVSLITN